MTDAHVEVHLKYLPKPHDGWEAYLTKYGERWAGNCITYDGPLEAIIGLTQNLAETLERITSGHAA